MPIASVVIVTLWPLSAIPLTELGVVSVAQGFQANGRDSVRYLPDFRAEFVKVSTAELRSWHCRVQLHRHNFEAAPPRAFVHTASMSMRSSLAGRFRFGYCGSRPGCAEQQHRRPAPACAKHSGSSCQRGARSGDPRRRLMRYKATTVDCVAGVAATNRGVCLLISPCERLTNPYIDAPVKERPSSRSRSTIWSTTTSRSSRRWSLRDAAASRLASDGIGQHGKDIFEEWDILRFAQYGRTHPLATGRQHPDVARCAIRQRHRQPLAIR